MLRAKAKRMLRRFARPGHGTSMLFYIQLTGNPRFLKAHKIFAKLNDYSEVVHV